MEENTKTEQSLELDEEQLQAITGATGPSGSGSSQQLDTFDQHVKNLIAMGNDSMRLANQAADQGKHGAANLFVAGAQQHYTNAGQDTADESNYLINSANRKAAWQIVQQQRSKKGCSGCFGR